MGSLGDSVGSLGLSTGSLGLSLGDAPGSLGFSLGAPVGLGTDGTCVGRAGIGLIDPGADSSTARGLAGTDDSAASGVSGDWVPGIWLDGPPWDGVVADFSKGSTGETGEINVTPASSPVA